MASDDRSLPALPEWMLHRLREARHGAAWPTSYATVLSRLQRGQPAATGDRRRRARALPGEPWRGRVLDLEG